MPRAQLGYFYPIEGDHGPVDPGFGTGGVDHPSQGLPPGMSGRPDNSLPHPPGHPSHPIVPATPTHPIALPPGTVWPPLPPIGSGKAWAFVAIQGYGHRWIVIDLDANAGHPLPPGPPNVAGHPLPPTPEPRR